MISTNCNKNWNNEDDHGHNDKETMINNLNAKTTEGTLDLMEDNLAESLLNTTESVVDPMEEILELRNLGFQEEEKDYQNVVDDDSLLELLISLFSWS